MRCLAARSVSLRPRASAQARMAGELRSGPSPSGWRRARFMKLSKLSSEMRVRRSLEAWPCGMSTGAANVVQTSAAEPHHRTIACNRRRLAHSVMYSGGLRARKHWVLSAVHRPAGLGLLAVGVEETTCSGTARDDKSLTPRRSIAWSSTSVRSLNVFLIVDTQLP